MRLLPPKVLRGYIVIENDQVMLIRKLPNHLVQVYEKFKIDYQEVVELTTLPAIE